MTKVSLLAVSLVLLSVAQAMAVDDMVCRYYAETAVRASDLSRDLHCGFSGARWSPNTDDHLRWCRQEGLDGVIREATGRLHQLNSCRAMCEQYVDDALLADRMNEDLGCGLHGSRYEHDPQAHMNWCQRTSEGAVIGEMRKRYKELERCTSSLRRRGGPRH